MILTVSLVFALSSCGSFGEETYVVKFDANGPENPKRQTVERGDKAEEPDVPSNPGYVFVGWFYDDDEWDFSDAVTENMTLDAEWELCENHKDKNEDFVCDKCDKEVLTLHEELGLKFYLPEEFRKFNTVTADIHYSTPDVRFQVQYMPKTDFEDVEMGYYISFDMTVKEYTEFLINENGWADPEKNEQYTYDEARNATEFSFFWSPDPDDIPYSYYRITIMKNETAFYVVMFLCDEDKYSEYNDMIEDLSELLSIAK